MSNNLTFYDRQKLEHWFRTKQSLRVIARILGRDHSVLVRELRRNGDGDRKKYRADIAQRMFEKRVFKQHRGKNVGHIKIKKEHGVDTYFCDPFASWQKGGVENANKLIRHYLPRKTNLNQLTDRDIYDIQEKLNNRPRRCLNYQTPNEVIHRVVH